jgi:pimeloyl-ACP methyl ester carboxylesterase
MSLFAAIEGNGPHRVLVLHGWALDSSVWLAARALSNQKNATYAYFDFPGYGVNRAEPPAPGIDGMARAALAAVDELGWTSYSVMGHSMGGVTAIRIATMRPDQVRGVVAVTPVSPAGTPLDADTYAAFEAAWADPGAAIKSALSPRIDPADLARLVDRNRATMDQKTWAAYLANWTSPDFMAVVNSYAAPTTLLCGETDPFSTPAYLAETLGHLRSGTLEVMPGAGHYPMIESVATFVQAVEKALGF